MMQLWQEWWVWIAAGLVLAMLEVLVSGYVLLGFAGGSIVTGGLIWIGFLGGRIGTTVLIMALASLACWWLLTRIFGSPRDGQTIIKHDINEN